MVDAKAGLGLGTGGDLAGDRGLLLACTILTLPGHHGCVAIVSVWPCSCRGRVARVVMWPSWLCGPCGCVALAHPEAELEACILPSSSSGAHGCLCGIARLLQFGQFSPAGQRGSSQDLGHDGPIVAAPGRLTRGLRSTP